MPKVMVIDDEPYIVKLLERFLTLKGFEAVGVEDGAKALELITPDSGVDLIITDMKMPGFSGIDIVKKISDINKNIPIIILSGCPIAQGSDFDNLNNMGYNPDEILCKPIDLFALLDIINKKLAKNN